MEGSGAIRYLLPQFGIRRAAAELDLLEHKRFFRVLSRWGSHPQPQTKKPPARPHLPAPESDPPDPRAQLLAACRERRLPPPNYSVAHAAYFGHIVKVMIYDPRQKIFVRHGKGRGPSREEAEREAALHAMNKLLGTRVP